MSGVREAHVPKQLHFLGRIKRQSHVKSIAVLYLHEGTSYCSKFILCHKVLCLLIYKSAHLQFFFSGIMMIVIFSPRAVVKTNKSKPAQNLEQKYLLFKYLSCSFSLWQGTIYLDSLLNRQKDPKTLAHAILIIHPYSTHTHMNMDNICTQAHALSHTQTCFCVSAPRQEAWKNNLRDIFISFYACRMLQTC